MVSQIFNKDIEKILDNRKITDSKLLSDSFGINCVKLLTSDKKNYVIKYYKKNNYKFNAINAEAENLKYVNNLANNLFPVVVYNDQDLLILSFIKNNNIKPNETRIDLLDAIVSLHTNNSNNYGFEFNTQIGGLEQKNLKYDSWVNFYREQRLGYIYEIINRTKPMYKEVNKKIDLILRNLEKCIPDKPKPSLLHGDLWEGNILFEDNKFVGFIDPGSFYGHNELEIAYLRWFNPCFIDNAFLDKYNDIIKIDKNYSSYEAIYQLYYSLLNVYLWDRNYIKDVQRLLNKIKI